MCDIGQIQYGDGKLRFVTAHPVCGIHVDVRHQKGGGLFWSCSVGLDTKSMKWLSGSA